MSARRPRQKRKKKNPPPSRTKARGQENTGGHIGRRKQPRPRETPTAPHAPQERPKPSRPRTNEGAGAAQPRPWGGHPHEHHTDRGTHLRGNTAAPIHRTRGTTAAPWIIISLNRMLRHRFASRPIFCTSIHLLRVCSCHYSYLELVRYQAQSVFLPLLVLFYNSLFCTPFSLLRRDRM